MGNSFFFINFKVWKAKELSFGWIIKNIHALPHNPDKRMQPQMRILWRWERFITQRDPVLNR